MQLFFKRILCVCIFFALPISIYAQPDTSIIEGDTIIGTKITQTYTQIFDSFAAPLNKARVPYGVLYDRVFPFVFLDQDTINNDTMTLDFFRPRRVS